MMSGLLTAAALRFGGLSFAMKALVVVGFAAAVALTVTSVYGVWHHQVFRSGYDRALLDIARADAKAIARAGQYRNRWRECRDAGRSWDQSEGECR